MKTSIFILIIFMEIISMQTGMAQTTSFITLKGKQFYDQSGQPFYPIVCNYEARLFAIAPNYTLHIIGPEHHYGLTGGVECLNQADCITQMTNDFKEIKKIGFNSVRTCGACGHYNKALDRMEYLLTTSDWISDYDYIAVYPPYEYNSTNQAAYDKIFSIFDAVHDAAFAADINVIWLFNGNGLEGYEKVNGVLVGLPGNEANLASAAVDQVVAHHMMNYSQTLAYDLSNEPVPNDKHYDFPKSLFCEEVATLYDAIKNPTLGDPNHLITIGGYGPEAVFYFDVNILKVDFFSIHVYFPTVPNSITYTQNDKFNMAKDYLYWLSQVSNKPIIIGEIGFRADPATPINFTDGNLIDQYLYAQETYEFIVKCGYSGYSWWQFQDEFDIINPATLQQNRSPYGVLYAGLPYSRKPICNYIHYISQAGNGTISGSCAKPTNYDSDIGPILIPVNSNSYHGIVTLNGAPCSTGVIQTFNYRYKSIDPNLKSDDFNYFFTNDNGEFTITQLPSEINHFSSEPIHAIKISTAGSDRIFEGDFWGSTFRPDGSTWPLTSLRFKYDDLIDGEPVTQNETFRSWNTLEVKNVTVNAPFQVDFTARNEIKVSDEFNAVYGSEVHIYPSETFIDCISIPWRIKNNSINEPENILSKINKNFIIINFKQPPNIFSLFPNPSYDNCKLVYYGNSLQKFNVDLIDQVGKVIKSFSWNGDDLVINSSELSSGYYILKITNNELCKIIPLIHN